MNKSILFLLLGILLFSANSEAQSNHQVYGARSGALGHSTSGLDDFWSIQNNQAGLATMKEAAAGFGLNERFAMKQLAVKYAGIIIPTKLGVFGLNYGYTGYSQYHESRTGLALGKKLSERFYLGLQLDYFQHQIAEGYGSAQAFSFQIGLRAKLNEELTMEAHAFNPVQAKWNGASDEKIPTTFKFGLAYTLSDQLLFVIETEKDMAFKPLIRGGMEYRITQTTSARIGYASIPARADANTLNISSEFTFGFGLQLKKLLTDVSVGYHQTLGWSPQLSFIYQFKSGEKGEQ